MIDDKKIEEAARYYCNNRYPASQDAPFIAEGFRHGANWAINELLKDLWHPASEEPKTYKRLIEKCYLDRVRYHDTMFLGTISWDKKVESDGIICWLYIDDLFPKEGGEQ